MPTLLRQGAVAGAVAGLVAALVMWLHTEPVIRRALAVEAARGGRTQHHDQELVSRTTQVLVGAGTVALAGLLFGLVFAVVFAATRHRMPGADGHAQALWLSVLGFCTFVLAPALVVPANPPAVGDPATVTKRTLVYLLAVLLGVLVVGAVFGLDRLLRNREIDLPVRRSSVLVAAVLLASLVGWALPSASERIPSDVPADLVWDFRLASLVQLGVMWATLGTVFGVLVTRRTGDVRDTRPALRQGAP